MGIVRGVNIDFWKGKKVFLTGHTGFKGGWLSIWLKKMGAEVKGYALEPETDSALFYKAQIAEGMQSQIGDIRDLEELKKSMTAFSPDILIHMAAQPLVRLSYTEPVETYSTNVMGTVNVLEAARSGSNLGAIVSVTTDKCYENNEWHWGYRENEPIGGHDPYSSSKGCAELVSSAYRRSFFSKTCSAALATARAGNVIGGGDWALDRLIPDIIRALQRGASVEIRNPYAIRPWQHVLDPLSGYLMLAERLYTDGQQFAEAWNFGPEDTDARSVEWITRQMCELWGDGASYVVDKGDHPHEAKYLKLDCSKAKNLLQWAPTWSLSKALESIVDWNQSLMNGIPAIDICDKQLTEYIQVKENEKLTLK